MGIPNSGVVLCKVPFDNSYKHVVRFDTKEEQAEYFLQRSIKFMNPCTHIRKTLTDGSLQSSVRVNAHVDELQFVNYLYFHNEEYENAMNGNRVIYAFVTKRIYINEGVTELVFETDVWQTYTWVYQLGLSFVEREHPVSDEIGENLVPEAFNIEDYIYNEITPDNYTVFNRWGYLVASADDPAEGYQRGYVMSGVYQGLVFRYFEPTLKTVNGTVVYDFTDLNNYLDEVESNDTSSVQFIMCVPYFVVKNHVSIKEDNTVSPTWVTSSVAPSWSQITIPFLSSNILFGTSTGTKYTPKNKKLFTYPYASLYATDNAGGEYTYAIEDFDTVSNPAVAEKMIVFDVYGDISAMPSVMAVPFAYKGKTNNFDESMTIKAFPQCSTKSDSFKLWWTKNVGDVAINAFGGLAAIGTGIAITAGTSGVGSVFGISGIVGGASQMASAFSSVWKAHKAPNNVNVGKPSNNLLTGLSQNKFRFYWRALKPQHAKVLDDYFTMYGYQTNEVKIPNTQSRPKWNYVKTIDCNILQYVDNHGTGSENVIGRGGIPNDDLKKLQSIYDNGVTIWKSTAVLGDYSQDNGV